MGTERKRLAARPDPVRARPATAGLAVPKAANRAVPAWPTAGARDGRAVIRRTINEVLDEKSGSRVRLYKDARVTGHDTVGAKRLLTAKLLIRKQTEASLDGDLLNEHERGLIDGRTEDDDMLTGKLASANLAICHKLASSDAQDQLLKAYDTGNLAALQDRVDRIKFVHWAEPGKLTEINQTRYADYQKAVEGRHQEAQKALTKILTYKTKEAVPLAAFNEFLDHVVNTPPNYFVGSQKINGPVSDNRDANFGNTKTRPRAMTLESIQLHKNDSSGNKFIDPTVASTFGGTSRVNEWGKTADPGELLTSSLPVPSAFSSPSKRKRTKPSPSEALLKPKPPNGVVKKTAKNKKAKQRTAKETITALLTKQRKRKAR